MYIYIYKEDTVPMKQRGFFPTGVQGKNQQLLRATQKVKDVCGMYTLF